MSQTKVVFPPSFWSANIVELFERAAYYAMFISITLYLTDLVGFDDIWAAWISGVFSAGLYFLPPFTGALADKIGFRRAMILAFTLLSIGYFFLGLLPYKAIVIPALLVVMLGGSFIKSIITGTVAKTTSEKNRARGYSIFYAMVNIGSFSGKTFAYPLRINLGVEYINFFSAACTFLAVIVVYFFYKNIENDNKKQDIRAVWNSLLHVVTNARLVVLILIVTGFWMIQHQLYATMPKYIIRTVGEHAKPEWIANVNPFVVVVFVVLITRWMKNKTSLTSMTIGMFLMPLSALAMSLSPVLESIGGKDFSILGLFSAHPITIMLIVGIAIQALAECFISPRYLEFFSIQAPKGEEGLYLGFSHLHSFLASILGFGLSGYLLTAYCPDPKTLTAAQLPHAYDQAYLIWYYFAAIGLVAGIALIIYGKVFNPKKVAAQ
ncbi:MAG: MFS transporter [Ignavibacteriales bacterium]|nr:MFS transporter [Ignavibacteriales bacterium]